MVLCYVPLCGSRSDQGRNIDKDGNKIMFHEFPADFVRRQLWISAITCQGKVPIKPEKIVDRSVICSLHFKPSDYKFCLKTRWLLSKAVPSIFPEYQKYMKRKQKRKHQEDNKPIIITEVVTDKTDQEQSTTELQQPQKPVSDTNKPIIGTLPLQPNSFKPGLKLPCLLPVVSGLFPKYPSSMQNTPKRQKCENEEKVSLFMKTECNETIVTGKTPSVHPAQGSVCNKSLEKRKRNTNDATEKDNVLSVNKCFTYKKMVKKLSLINKPNQFWGVTPTDKFTIFSRWNKKYIPEKRIVIDKFLHSKVFLGELEINAMNLMEFTCVDDISALLQKVENIKFVEEKPVINHCS